MHARARSSTMSTLLTRRRLALGYAASSARENPSPTDPRTDGDDDEFGDDDEDEAETTPPPRVPASAPNDDDEDDLSSPHTSDADVAG